MGTIFISYRREDSGSAAGRIYDWLCRHFGEESVFLDVDNIPFGVDFRKHLNDAVGSCDVLLAIIGDSWLESQYEDGPRQGERRLDDPSDYMRIEIEAALQRDIRVIPVLVGRARMPTEAELPDGLKNLAYRNYAEVRPGQDFRNHVQRLIQNLDGALSNESTSAEAAPGDVAAKGNGKGETGKREAVSDVEKFLEELLGDRAARPPRDIEQAIVDAFADIDQALNELRSTGGPLTLKNVDAMVSRAIEHGAGIYNHSKYGRIGCGRIYHRAAAGLVSVADEVSTDPNGRPATGVDLAIDWLQRIIESTPVVRDSSADEIAWELRYAFDTIPLISSLDELHEAIVRSDAKDETHELTVRLLQEAIRSGRQIGHPQVSAYCLRHMAQVLAWLIETRYASHRRLKLIGEELRQTVNEYPRIDGKNHSSLKERLSEQLESAQEAYAQLAAGEGRRKWTNPLNWISRN